MEARFRALSTEYGDRLEAHWAPTPLNDSGEHWFFFGSAGNRELERFRALAGRAAVELGKVGEGSAVFFWLDSLRAKSPHRADGPLVTYYNARGSVTEQYEVVDELHKASAEYCLQLARNEEAGRAGPPASLPERLAGKRGRTV
jgi:hypothetical protein